MFSFSILQFLCATALSMEPVYKLGDVMPGVFKTTQENPIIVGFGNNDKEAGQHAATLKQHKQNAPSTSSILQTPVGRFQVSSAEFKPGQGWILHHKHHIDKRDFVSYVASLEKNWEIFKSTVDQILQRFMEGYHQAVYEHKLSLLTKMSSSTEQQLSQHPEFKRIVPDVQAVTSFDGGAQNLGMFRVGTRSGKRYVLKFEPFETMDQDSPGQLKHGCYLFNEKSFSLLREKNRPDLFVLPHAVFVDKANNVAALLMDEAPGKCLADMLKERHFYTEGKRALLAYVRLQIEVAKLDLDSGDGNLGSPIYDAQTGKIVYIDCGDWKTARSAQTGMDILSHLRMGRGALNWVKLREATDEESLLKLADRECQVLQFGKWHGLFDLFQEKKNNENCFLMFDRFFTLVKEALDLIKQDYPSSYSTYGACFGPTLPTELTRGNFPYLKDGNLQKAIDFWAEARKKNLPEDLFKFAKTSYPQLATEDYTANPLLDTICSYYFFQHWLALHDKFHEKRK